MAEDDNVNRAHQEDVVTPWDVSASDEKGIGSFLCCDEHIVRDMRIGDIQGLTCVCVVLFSLADYDKLIREFGSEPISPELLQRFERVTKRRYVILASRFVCVRIQISIVIE